MKNILMIAGTYYPDSMATIGITQRIAEEFAKMEYKTFVYTVRYCGHKNPGYPEKHNGVIIYDTDDFAVWDLKRKEKLEKRRRILKHFCINRVDNIVYKKLKKVIYENPYERMMAEIEAEKIEHIIKEKNIDTIISIALPFVIHKYASVVKRRNDFLKWIPISFDPYAYDEVTNIHRKKECIQEEISTFKNADRIMFPVQFCDDYKESEFREKICFYQFPNIRKMNYSFEDARVAFDPEKINCVFLGNLYLIQRHPRFLFELFSSINNKNIVLHIIGDLVDIPEQYINEWKGKFEGRLIYTGRVSQQTAINAMLDADVLINIGHSTTNQCPSKILDYMSTGKPIIHVSKIEKCTSLPYFNKYPRVITLKEKQGISEETVRKVEKFILEYKESNALRFEDVEKIFSESTMDNMIDKIKNFGMEKKNEEYE